MTEAGTPFWSTHQPGTRFTEAEVGTPEFFAEAEAKRYNLEPHIPEMVQFDRWIDRDVLEAGCGIGTDAMQFVRAGARYTGLDASPVALALAREQFRISSASARLVHGSITQLPFRAASFDLVFSHGVIHHIDGTDQAVREYHRVLRPGGVAIVMVYHRRSFNYFATIMALRRALVTLLALPGATSVVARITGEDIGVLQGHRQLLHSHGVRYLTDRGLFLSNNTDGPGNPLSKVYSRREAMELFSDFDGIQTHVRHLNLRTYPGGARLAGTSVARALGRRIGWHLYVEARKADR